MPDTYLISMRFRSASNSFHPFRQHVGFLSPGAHSAVTRVTRGRERGRRVSLEAMKGDRDVPQPPDDCVDFHQEQKKTRVSLVSAVF